MIEILDGNQSAAWAARLSRVKCVPCFPVTPQTEIIETLAKWNADGTYKCEFNEVESEHSVISAAVGSEMTGARTFTASSSQGLLLMTEILPIASGTRMPIVMVNVSRSISAPIALWSDHNDFMAMRDMGWLTLVSETNQEVLDSVIIAYKIAEKIKLPAMINMDGFIHSYTREEVKIPEQSVIDKFLPKLKLKTKLDIKNPMSLGVPVLREYMKFRSQVHKSLLNSKKEIIKVQKEWKQLTGRSYDLIEKYQTSGAKTVLVMIGANSTIAKSAIDELRSRGKKVGLVRIRAYRPFPYKELEKALTADNIAVLDQNISLGSSGILYPEVLASIYGSKKKVSNYVFGLGGKAVSKQDFIKIINNIEKSKGGERKWVM